eukprot:gene18158-19970_t
MDTASSSTKRQERRTSRSYFSSCGRGSSSSLERLSSAVPIRKILASFDISKKTAFFRLESCNSYSICFITKTSVIDRRDFGAPNTVLWSKLVKEYQGKAPVQFNELQHRQFFMRTKLEDSCLHGFYVIGERKKKRSTQRDKTARSLSASLLAEGKGTRRGRRKKNGRRKPRRNKPKRNRQAKQRKRKAGRKRSTQGCKTKDDFCVRRCIAWNGGDCTQLQISCNFMCPLKT